MARLNEYWMSLESMKNLFTKSKFFQWTGMGLALLIFCGTGLCQTKGDQPRNSFDYDWPMTNAGKEWVKLRIPRAYGFLNAVADAMEKQVYPNGRPKTDGVIIKELLISALWPDLVPDMSENHKELHVPGGGRSMDLFMRSGAEGDFDGKYYNGLQRSIEFDIDEAKHVCIHPARLFNSDGTMNHAVCHDRDYPDVKSPRFGLKRLGVDFKKYPDLPKNEYNGLFKNDIYYTPDVGSKLETEINCMAEEVETVDSGPGPYIIPHCTQTFIFKPLNAWVTVTYRRVYLQDWRAIQSASEKLLQSFILAQPINSANTTGKYSCRMHSLHRILLFFNSMSLEVIDTITGIIWPTKVMRMPNSH